MNDEKWAKFFELMEEAVGDKGVCIGSITGAAKEQDAEATLEEFVDHFGGELPEEDDEDNSTKE